LVRPAVDTSLLHFEPSVEFFRADLRAAKDLKEAFVGIDALVHLAAAVTGDEFDQFVAAVVATENLLNAMQTSETRRIVFISSFSVYCFDAIRGSLTEESPVASKENKLYQRDGYAIAKAWQERVVRERAAQNEWDLCVLRPGFIYGPGNEELAGTGFPVGPFFFRVMGGNRLPVTYVENAADAVVRAAECDDAYGKTLNLVDSDGESPATYARAFARWSQQRKWTIPLPYWLGVTNAAIATGISRLIFRGKGKLPGILIPTRFAARFKPLRFPNQRIRDVLNWQPKISFDEALQRTFPFHRQP
jgi:UDP-glucose 4-epimerase